MSRSMPSAGMALVATLITAAAKVPGSAFISIELRRSGDPTEPIKTVMKQALAKLK